jgi:hypothetical protein
MHSRKVRRNSRSRPALRVFLVSAACVPVLVIAYAVTAAHAGRAVDTANVSVPGAGRGAGGWGRGGYTMMPGPAGSVSPGSGAVLPVPGAVSPVPGNVSPVPGAVSPVPSGHAAAGSEGAAASAAVTSQNWAGYASAGNPGTFTSVSASWVQPAVTCTGGSTGGSTGDSTFSSFWAGLDGDGTATVEQTGTEADCDAGSATYQGWFEMFPNAPVFYSNPVKPGDAMSASVAADGGGAFTLTLTDTTEEWTQTQNQTSATAQVGSAEVIAEAPSGDDGNVLPLSNFGAVSFTAVTVDSDPIGNENPSALTMVAADGVTEATPSALTGGNAFTVTRDDDGTTTPAPSPSPTATAPATGGSPGRHHHHHHHVLGG